MGQKESTPFKGDIIRSLERHEGPVLHCAFSPDGKVLASCSTDKNVILWNVVTGDIMYTLKGHADDVTYCCFYENVLTTCSKDRTAVLWVYEHGRCASRLAIHSAAVNACAISSSGQHLATCSDDKTIRIIKFLPGTGAFVDGSKMTSLIGHRDAVNDVKFSPDGYYLASASHDTTIRIWQTETGACARILDESVGAVTKLCYSPLEGHMMSISGPGNFVSVWNTTSYVVEKVLEADDGREIQNIAITPNGMVIIGLSEDNKITLWATMTDNCVPKQRTTPHIKGVTTIALHDDGNEWCIATADRDGVINIWN